MRHVHSVLGKALEDAEYRELVRADVAKLADPPPRENKSGEMKTWSAEQPRAFLEETKGTRLYPLWHFFAQTGLRRGEVLGLMLDALDLGTGKVMMHRQRKQNG